VLKKIAIFYLLIIILTSLTFSFFFASFNLQTDYLKGVNETFRHTFIKNFTLRHLFKLNQPGDAKSDYYNAKPFSKLKVEIYNSSFGTLYTSTEDLIKNNGFGQVVKKPSGVTINERNLNDVPSDVDSHYLDDLAKSVPKYTKDTAILRIYILSKYAPHQTFLGMTIGAYAFAIFKSSIEEGSENDQIRQDSEWSTILHEMGHLLGIGHIGYENCVMKGIIDVPNSGAVSLISTEYCYDEIQAIKKANY